MIPSQTSKQSRRSPLITHSCQTYRCIMNQMMKNIAAALYSSFFLHPTFAADNAPLATQPRPPCPSFSPYLPDLDIPTSVPLSTFVSTSERAICSTLLWTPGVLNSFLSGMTPALVRAPCRGGCGRSILIGRHRLVSVKGSITALGFTFPTRALDGRIHNTIQGASRMRTHPGNA